MESTTEKDWKAETRPVLDEIRRLIRYSDLSQREVEKSAGFSKGYLSQLLGQNLDLKIRHVLAILEVLEVPPSQFFQRVYGRYPDDSRPASLDVFQTGSAPLDQDLRRQLETLYRERTDVLEILERRLDRCESSVDQLKHQLADRGVIPMESGEPGIEGDGS